MCRKGYLMIVAEPIQTVALVFGFACFAAFLAGVVYALTQIAKTPHLEPLAKAAWVLLLLAVPVLGVAAWFAFSRHRPREMTRGIQ
jgi:hypothetical protein